LSKPLSGCPHADGRARCRALLHGFLGSKAVLHAGPVRFSHEQLRPEGSKTIPRPAAPWRWKVEIPGRAASKASYESSVTSSAQRRCRLSPGKVPRPVFEAVQIGPLASRRHGSRGRSIASGAMPSIRQPIAPLSQAELSGGFEALPGPLSPREEKRPSTLETRPPALPSLHHHQGPGGGGRAVA